MNANYSETIYRKERIILSTIYKPNSGGFTFFLLCVYVWGDLMGRNWVFRVLFFSGVSNIILLYQNIITKPIKLIYILNNLYTRDLKNLIYFNKQFHKEMLYELYDHDSNCFLDKKLARRVNINMLIHQCFYQLYCLITI